MEDFKIPILKNEEDAHKKAKETLVKLFDDKMLTIDNIKSLINDFHKVANQSSIEVFNKIEHNITELDSSLKSIDQIISNMQETSTKHQKFFSSWKKITMPLNEYGEDLEKLMLAKKNVSLMFNNLEMYVKVQDEIKEMRRLMQEDKYSNLTLVYKKIRYFEYIRIALIEKLKKEARSEKLNNLAEHLLCVQQFSNEFFDEFWSYFKDAYIICQTRPEFIVKCVRLIEEDKNYLNSIKKVFKIYNSPEEKFRGINESLKTDKSKVRDTTMVAEEEEENLPQTLLDKLPYLIKEDFNNRFTAKNNREETLEETLKMVNELYIIYTKVVPCFPPHYDIFNVYKKAYLENIQLQLKSYLNQEELENSPGLLIPIAHWLSQFGEGLQKVGVDIFETELAGDITYYMHYFYEHINEVLNSNLNTVLKKDAQDKNKLKTAKNIDLGNIQSYYATDVYNAITNVIDLLSGDFKGQLLFQIINQIFAKLEQLIKASDENIKKSENLIVACVYVNDANKCLEQFPKFKKKIKSLLPKDLYKHVKLSYINSNPGVLSLYNNNIRNGCQKIIELMIREVESKTLNKMFTSEWNDEVLEDIFGTFKEYFNKGFVKILKSQNNLLILVRSFIDSFVWYYVEEIMHSVRSLNRKILVNFKDSALVNYQFKYLTMNENELVYKKKKKKEKEKEENEIVDLNQLSKIDNNNEAQIQEFKKYSFPVKKFKDSDKTINSREVINRMLRDKEIFSDFLYGFSDETTTPFSNKFSETLGSNYIKNFENKFDIMINVTKCKNQNDIKEKIIQLKEYYYGNDGKALSEALLYIREDWENVTKQDMKSYFLSCFDPK
jgi:exocyst complex component 3